MDILNDILSALSVSLDALFPNIPICTELVPNNLPQRCFLIGYAGEATVTQEVSGRYKVSGKLDITYLPPEKEVELQTKREVNEVFARLALNLGVITFKALTLRLYDHTRQGSDESALHDICKFSTFIFKNSNTPLMQNIKTDKELLK